MIHLTGIRKIFDGKVLLSNLDFEVPAGETMAITGPSGCGKTTLLRIIAGLERPEAGTVRLAGRLASGPGHWTPPHSRGVALAFQEPVLWPHMNVRANVAFAADRTGLARIQQTLDELGLGPLADARPQTLSGGEARRVELARAVLSGRKVLLLDEPLAHLDADLADRVHAWLERETGQLTRIVVTHDPVEAARWSPRFLRL